MNINKAAEELEAKLKVPRTGEAEKGRLCESFAKEYGLHFHGFKPVSGDPVFTTSDDPYSEPKTIEEQIADLEGKSLEELG